MDISRRDLLLGGGVAITSGSLGFASGMAFESATRETVEYQPSDSNSSGTDSGGTDEPESKWERIGTELVVSNRPTLGDDDAPVRIVYWNDYQCPFCYKFEQETLPIIVSDYIENGDVQMVLKPVSVFGEDSQNSALGAECVYEQGVSESVFQNWHNRLYEEFQNGEERNNGWASPENQAVYAEDFNAIDGASLRDCIESGEYSSKLQTDRAEGMELNMEGTPFFLIYNTETGENQTITGAQPFSSFGAAIDSVLD